MSPADIRVLTAANGKTILIRPAAITDVPQIHALMAHYASLGNLLPRTRNELYRHLRDFFVAEIAGEIAACAALEIFTENLGEVRSLVVAEQHEKQGIGRMLVLRICEEARLLGLTRLMALTYVVPFFEKLGFKVVPKEALPEKVWTVCVSCYKFNHCDETAVLLEL